LDVVRRQRETANLYNEALRHHEARRYDEARELFLKTQALAPGYKDISVRLAAIARAKEAREIEARFGPSVQPEGKSRVAGLKRPKPKSPRQPRSTLFSSLEIAQQRTAEVLPVLWSKRSETSQASPSPLASATEPEPVSTFPRPPTAEEVKVIEAFNEW